MQNNTLLKNINAFYACAIFLLLIGLAGIGMGLYVKFIRGATQGELILNNSLMLYSVGMVGSAIVHFGAFNTIRKLKDKIEAS